jgi:hypothetical protein
LAKEDELVLGLPLMSTITKIMIEPELQNICIAPNTRPRNWKTLIDHIEELAIENHSAALSLNVNRFNKACALPEKRILKSLKGWILKLDTAI